MVRYLWIGVGFGRTRRRRRSSGRTAVVVAVSMLGSGLALIPVLPSAVEAESGGDGDAAAELVPISEPASPVDPSEPEGAFDGDAGRDESVGLDSVDVDRAAPVRSEWGVATRTFETDDPGLFATESFSEPVNVRNADGRWVTANALLVDTGEGEFVSRRTAVDIIIAADPAADGLVEVEVGSGASAAFSLSGAGGDEVDFEDIVADRGPPLERTGEFAEAQTTGYRSDTVTFEEILPGVDAEVTPQRDGVKEVLVLDRPDAARSFQFPLTLDGLTARLNDLGEVEYVDAEGQVTLMTPVGFMEDSANEGSGMGRVTYRLSGAPGDQVLSLALDDEWLDDPARVWPVRVDPSMYKPLAWNDDTFVLQNWPANWSTHPEVRTGTDTEGTYKYRSFMHFTTTPLAGKVIDSAALTLWGVHSPSCTARRVNVYRVTQAWTGSALTTWNDQPSAV